MDIKHLEINDNNFNETFDFYPELKSLLINNTSIIKQIPSNLKKLELLTINSSSIEYIDELENIECIQLYNCSNIKINVKNIQNVKSLYLINCSNVNINIDDLINVKKLVLNNYDDIVNGLSKLLTLEELYISNSNIKQVPKTLNNIKIIKLNNCYNTVEIPYKFFTKDISYQKCNVKIVY